MKLKNKIKVRIVERYGWYVGQVFVDGHWETVTENCFTKWGAQRELIRYKKNNYPESFYI